MDAVEPFRLGLGHPDEAQGDQPETGRFQRLQDGPVFPAATASGFTMENVLMLFSFCSGLTARGEPGGIHSRRAAPRGVGCGEGFPSPPRKTMVRIAQRFAPPTRGESAPHAHKPTDPPATSWGSCGVLSPRAVNREVGLPWRRRDRRGSRRPCNRPNGAPPSCPRRFPCRP